MESEPKPINKFCRSWSRKIRLTLTPTEISDFFSTFQTVALFHGIFIALKLLGFVARRFKHFSTTCDWLARCYFISESVSDNFWIKATRASAIRWGPLASATALRAAAYGEIDRSLSRNWCLSRCRSQSQNWCISRCRSLSRFSRVRVRVWVAGDVSTPQLWWPGQCYQCYYWMKQHGPQIK